MKKVYLDQTQVHECMAIFIKDVEIIHAGTTIYSMPVKDKNSEYERFADEYDIHFIFDDDIPQIDFYTIPQVDIMATDSHGGFIGTVGQITDMESDAKICYIDRSHNCYLITENAKDFISGISTWRSSLKEYNEIQFFSSKTEAEKALEFIDSHEIRKNLGLE